MGLIRGVAKLTMRSVLGATSFFIDKAKHRETHTLLRELKEIDRKVKRRIVNIHGAKSEFSHLLHKLENTLSRLYKRGEHLEAEHIYQVYERYAKVFKDEKLLKRIKKLKP